MISLIPESPLNFLIWNSLNISWWVDKWYWIQIWIKKTACYNFYSYAFLGRMPPWKHWSAIFWDFFHVCCLLVKPLSQIYLVLWSKTLKGELKEEILCRGSMNSFLLYISWETFDTRLMVTDYCEFQMDSFKAQTTSCILILTIFTNLVWINYHIFYMALLVSLQLQLM